MKGVALSCYYDIILLENRFTSERGELNVTIKDVARIAQVAPSTVSHVLNGTKYVSPEVTKRVMEAIDEIDYTPNSIARSLKTKTTKTVGLVLPDISNPFFGEIAKGVEDVAEQFGYTVLICNTYENPTKESSYLKTLLQKDVDGLIYIGTGSIDEKLLKKYHGSIVMVDREQSIDHRSWGTVVVDNFGGAYNATEYLINKGENEILFISGPLSFSTYRNRLDGFKKACQEHDVRIDDGNIYEVVKDHISIEGGKQIIAELHQSKRLKNAIFAANDLLAIGTIQELKQLGYKVPEDIMVVGYDDIYPSSLITPMLTTISQPKYEIGTSAMEILLDLMNKEEKITKKEIELFTELVIRDSA